MVDEDFETTETVTVTPGAIPSDEEGQTVTYSIEPVSVSFANVSIESMTGEVTITSVADSSGVQEFTVTAIDDGGTDNAGDNTSTQTFTLTVNPVNDAPVFTEALPDTLGFGEDEALTEDFSPYLYDADQDVLSLTVSGGENVAVEITDLLVSFSLPVIWHGIDSVNFTVDDNQGGTASTWLIINVTQVYGCNDPYAENYDTNALVDDGSCEYTETVDLSEDGITSEDVVVTSDDGDIGMTISSGTQLLLDGEPLSENVEITVSEFAPDSVEDLTSGFEGASEIVGFEPFGLTFSEPVDISIAYESTRSGNELLMSLDDDNDTSWKLVSGANCSDNNCTASVNSFGLYTVFKVTELENVPALSITFITDFGQMNPGDVTQIDQFIDVAIDNLLTLNSVSLNYMVGGGLLTESGGIFVEEAGSVDNYRFTVPSEDVTNTGLMGFVSLEDILERTVVSDTVQVRVSFSSMPLVSTTSEKYVMISSPGDLDNAGFINVLEDDFGAYNNTEWRIFRWDSELEDYREYYDNVPSSFEPGLAYWLITRTGMQASTGSGESMDLTGYTINIKEGWNMIGSPYNFDISLESVTISPTNTVEPNLHNYTGDQTNQYEATTTMIHTIGYWLYSNGEATIQINPMESVPPGNMDKLLAPENDGGWQSSVAVSINGFGDTQNRFGVHPESENEWDRKDFRKPPEIGDYAILGFDNTAWADRPGLYRTDIRSEQDELHTWDLYVKTNQKGICSVYGLDLGNLPEHFQVKLIDIPYGAIHDLRDQGQYRFSSSGSEQKYPFRMIVGEQDAVAREIESLGLVPDQYKLDQNTPNPFNPITSIRISLPEQAIVTIKIFNILGKEIAVITEGSAFGAGFHRLIWNGKTSAGLSAPSGVYFYQADIKNDSGESLFHKSRKMLLVK
jgi:hypothetical protein